MPVLEGGGPSYGTRKPAPPRSSSVGRSSGYQRIPSPNSRNSSTYYDIPDLDRFMGALSGNESGGDYSARNAGSRAYGKYQIMPSNWGPWAKEAGLSYSAPQTPANQERVARHKIAQYWKKYRNWDAVAIAWFAGPGRANSFMRGDKSVLRLDDKKAGGGSTVAAYIAKIRRQMNNTPPHGYGDTRGSNRIPVGYGDPRGAGASQAVGGDLEWGDQKPVDPAEMLSQLFQMMGQYQSGELSELPLEMEEIKEATEQFLEDVDPEHQWELPNSDVPYDEDSALRFFGDLHSLRTRQALLRAMEQPGDLGVPDVEEPEAEGAPPAGEPGNVIESGNAFVAELSKYLGTPYVWGGATPRGFDCSGLIQYVARKMGVNLPRVSRDQARVGKEVGSLMDARPGDLVAFTTKRTGNQIGHIGVYVGGGKMLHAPYTGAKVRIDSIGNRKPTTIRRITGISA